MKKKSSTPSDKFSNSPPLVGWVRGGEAQTVAPPPNPALSSIEWKSAHKGGGIGKLNLKSHGLRVLVIGSGMYACGKGTEGFGTILPALYENTRSGLVGAIGVAATQTASIRELQKKVRGLRHLMGVEGTVQGWPRKGRDSAAFRKALKEFAPDCVIVSVPDHLHADVCAAVIRSGVHVLCVKPLTPTLREASELVRLAQKHRVYGAVEFHKRYDKANRKMRDMLSAGKIGEALYANVTYSQKKMIPLKIFRAWAAKSNIFQYLGVHYVDLIYFLTRAKPLRVLATAQKNLLTANRVDTYDAIQVLTEWKLSSGKTFVSCILTNWIDPDTTSATSDQKISIVGTRGRFDSDQKNRGLQVVTDQSGIEDINPYFSQFFLNEDGAAFRGYGEQSIRQFLEDVSQIKEGRTKPEDLTEIRPSFKEALVSTTVIEAAGKSLKGKSCWVKISL